MKWEKWRMGWKWGGFGIRGSNLLFMQWKQNLSNPLIWLGLLWSSWRRGRHDEDHYGHCMISSGVCELLMASWYAWENVFSVLHIYLIKLTSENLKMCLQRNVYFGKIKDIQNGRNSACSFQHLLGLCLHSHILTQPVPSLLVPPITYLKHIIE